MAMVVFGAAGGLGQALTQRLQRLKGFLRKTILDFNMV